MRKEWDIYGYETFYDGPHLAYWFRPKDAHQDLWFLQVSFSPWLEDGPILQHQSRAAVWDLREASFLETLIRVGLCRTHIEEIWERSINEMKKYLKEQGVQWYERSQC